MTSKRKLYREDEKLFFLHSYYQSGMSKHAFCRTSKHGLCKCSRMTVNRIRTTHFAVSTISAGLGKK